MCENKQCLIPFQKMVSLRNRAAIAHVRRTKNVEKLYPEKFYPYRSDFDPDYNFWSELNKLPNDKLFIKVDASRVETVRRSIFTKEGWQSVVNAAERAAAKRKTVQNYNQRVKDSENRPVSLKRQLGNIGNNLENCSKPVRKKRYSIQRFIQSEGLSESQYVCNCGTNISPFVHMKKNRQHGNVKFNGVATCSSVWACPVCRAKIVDRRAKDLETIYKNGTAAGFHFHHITFTFSHGKYDNLAQLYGSSTLRTGLSGAFTEFRQSYCWSKEFKPKTGFIGDIRAVEITWGEKNGFHPHIHFIVITKKKFDPDRWQNKLLKSWKRYCKKNGIGVPNQRGVKIEPVHKSNQVSYLSKWSVANELSSPDAKEAKNGNFSIAELEYCLVDEVYRGLKGITLKEAASVLRSYYAAMQGQKQLVYGGLNTGWKDLLLPDDITDEEITADEYQAEFESQLCVIRADVYRKARKRGILNKLIEEIESIEEKNGNLHSCKVAAIVKLYFKRQKIPGWQNVHGRTTFDNDCSVKDKFHDSAQKRVQ